MTTLDVPKEKCAGYIQIVFSDSVRNAVIELGGAGFLTSADLRTEWARIPAFEGAHTEFIADLLDADDDLVDDKPVSAETVETLLGKPLPALIAEGRAKLEALMKDAAVRLADVESVEP